VPAPNRPALLAVEDEDQVRVLAESYLEEQGHEVLSAGSVNCPTNCGFTGFAQRLAAVSGAGGFCAPNTLTYRRCGAVRT
jgi:CheY-like chemotaxis protein